MKRIVINSFRLKDANTNEDISFDKVPLKTKTKPSKKRRSRSKRKKPHDSSSFSMLKGQLTGSISVFSYIPKKTKMEKVLPIVEEILPLKNAVELIQSIFNEFIAEAFREPVDWRAYELFDYLDIITEPMDLGTIQRKLEDGEYSHDKNLKLFSKSKDIEDGQSIVLRCLLVSDVYLVFDNCVKYNGESTPISLAAQDLKEVFTQRYYETCKPVDDEKEALTLKFVKNVSNEDFSLEEKTENCLFDEVPFKCVGIFWYELEGRTEGDIYAQDFVLKFKGSTTVFDLVTQEWVDLDEVSQFCDFFEIQQKDTLSFLVQSFPFYLQAEHPILKRSISHLMPEFKGFQKAIFQILTFARELKEHDSDIDLKDCNLAQLSTASPSLEQYFDKDMKFLDQIIFTIKDMTVPLKLFHAITTNKQRGDIDFSSIVSLNKSESLNIYPDTNFSDVVNLQVSIVDVELNSIDYKFFEKDLNVFGKPCQAVSYIPELGKYRIKFNNGDVRIVYLFDFNLLKKKRKHRFNIDTPTSFNLSIPSKIFMRLQEIVHFIQLCVKAISLEINDISLDAVAAALFIKNFSATPYTISQIYMILIDTLTKFSLQDLSEKLRVSKTKSQKSDVVQNLPKIFYGSQVKFRYGLQIEHSFLNWVFHKIRIVEDNEAGRELKFSDDVAWLATNEAFIYELFDFYIHKLKWDPGFAPRKGNSFVDLERLFILVIFKGGYFYIRGKHDIWENMTYSFCEGQLSADELERIYKYYLLEFEIYKMKKAIVEEEGSYVTLPELEFKGLNTISNRSVLLKCKSAFFEYLLEKFPTVDMSQNLEDVGQIHIALEEWLLMDRKSRSPYIANSKEFVCGHEKVKDTTTISKSFHGVVTNNNLFSKDDLHESWEAERNGDNLQQAYLVSEENWVIVLDMILKILSEHEKQQQNEYDFRDILGEYDLLEEEKELFDELSVLLGNDAANNNFIATNEDKAALTCKTECEFLIFSLLTHPMLKLDNFLVEDDDFEEKMKKPSSYWYSLLRFLNDHYSFRDSSVVIEAVFRDIQKCTKGLTTVLKSRFDDNYFSTLLQDKFEQLSVHSTKNLPIVENTESTSNSTDTIQFALHQRHMDLVGFLLLKEKEEEYECKDLGIPAALKFLAFVGKVNFNIFFNEQKRTRRSRPFDHFSGKEAYMQELELRVRGGNYGKVGDFDFSKLFTEVSSFLEETTGFSIASETAIKLCARCAVYISKLHFPDDMELQLSGIENNPDLSSPQQKNLNQNYTECLFQILDGYVDSKKMKNTIGSHSTSQHVEFLATTFDTLEENTKLEIIYLLFENTMGVEYLQLMQLYIVDVQEKDAVLRNASINKVFGNFRIEINSKLGHSSFKLNIEDYGILWCLSIDTNAVQNLMNEYGEAKSKGDFRDNCHIKQAEPLDNSEHPSVNQFHEVNARTKPICHIPKFWKVDSEDEFQSYNSNKNLDRKTFMSLNPIQKIEIMEKLMSEILDINAFRTFVTNKNKSYKKRKKLLKSSIMTRSQVVDIEARDTSGHSREKDHGREEAEENEADQNNLKRKPEERELRSSTRKKQKLMTTHVDIEALIFSLKQQIRSQQLRLGYKSVIASASDSDFIPFCTARKLYQLQLSREKPSGKSTFELNESELHTIYLNREKFHLELRLEREMEQILVKRRDYKSITTKRRERITSTTTTRPTTPTRVKGIFGESKSSFFEYCVIDIITFEIPAGSRFGAQDKIIFKDSIFPKGVLIEQLKLSKEHPLFAELSLLRVGDKLVKIRDDQIGEGMYDADFVNNIFSMTHKQTNSIAVSFEIYRSVFLNRLSTLKRVELQPVPFYNTVRDLGGYENVVENLWWQKVRKALRLPHATSSGFQLKKSFLSYFSNIHSAPAPSDVSLIPFEKPYPLPKEVTDRNLIERIYQSRQLASQKLPVTPRIIRRQKVRQGDALPEHSFIAKLTYQEALIAYIAKLSCLEEDYIPNFVSSLYFPGKGICNLMRAHESHVFYKLFLSLDSIKSAAPVLVRYCMETTADIPEISMIRSFSKLSQFVHTLDRSNLIENRIFKELARVWPDVTLSFRALGGSVDMLEASRATKRITVPTATILHLTIKHCYICDRSVFYVSSIETKNECQVKKYDTLHSIDEAIITSQLPQGELIVKLNSSNLITFSISSVIEIRYLERLEGRILNFSKNKNISCTAQNVAINSSLFIKTDGNTVMDSILSIDAKLFDLTEQYDTVKNIRKRWRWLHSWGDWKWNQVRHRVLEIKNAKKGSYLFRLQLLLELMLRAYISSLPPVHDICFQIEDDIYLLNREYSLVATKLGINQNEYLSVTLENAPLEERWIERVRGLKSEDEALLLSKWLLYEGIARIISANLVEKSLRKSIDMFNASKSSYLEDIRKDKLADGLLWYGIAKVNEKSILPKKSSPSKNRRRSGRMLQKLRYSNRKHPEVKLPLRVSGKNFLKEFEKLLVVPDSELVPNFNGVICQRTKYEATYRVRKNLIIDIGSYDTAVEAAFAHDLVLLLFDGKKSALNFSVQSLIENMKDLPSLSSLFEELQKHKLYQL